MWQLVTDLTVEIYRITRNFPREEVYGLTNQIRRAVVSTGSNIAEGFGRKSYREKDYFYAVAYGSLLEVEHQLVIANRIGYIQTEDHKRIDEDMVTIRKMLSTLQKVNRKKGE